MHPIHILRSHGYVHNYSEPEMFAQQRLDFISRRLHEAKMELDAYTNPELTVIRVSAAEPHTVFTVSAVAKEAVERRLRAHGWHHVAYHPTHSFVELGLMKTPIAVVLHDGSDFDLPYVKGVTAENRVVDVCTNGCWRDHELGREFVPHTSIHSVRIDHHRFLPPE